MRGEAGAPPADFLAVGGTTGARIRAHDWTATPLGPAAGWPQSLRTAVGMVLASGFPSCIVWGPGLVTLHNDAFRPILGAKPEALGRPYSEVWSEAWDVLGPIAERSFAGEATFIEDHPLTVERNGYPEEAFFTLCYSPIRDETGAVAGFLNTVVETSGKVQFERRQAFLLALEERLREVADPQALTLAAAEALGRHVGAARAGYGEISAAGETVAVDHDWTDGSVASLRGEARLLDAFGHAVIAELRAGRTLVVEDCLTDPRTAGETHAATWASIGTRSLIVVPRLEAGRMTAILYIHEPEPRRWSGAELGLAEDAAQRTWAAVERARAEAALRESEERFKFLDRLGAATAHAFAPGEIMAMTAGLLGSHLRATRCAYADVDADNDRFTIRDDWTDGVPSSAGEYSLDLFGSRAAADMRAGRTLVVRDVGEELPPGDGGGMFSAIGIKAIICCPLVKQGRLVAMMAVHQSSPRQWTRGDITLLETVVERAWAHIERVRAEAVLRESEERFRLIVENARDYAIFTVTSEGQIDTWLPGAAHVFGWSAKEAAGRPLAMTYTPEDRERGQPAEELEICRREGKAPNVRWHLRQDGTRVFIEGSVYALHRADGAIRGFLKIGQDVTARRAAEERQALLAREVDHRAKNALAVVQAALRLTPKDDVQSYASAVEGRVGALARAQTMLAEERWNGADLRALLGGELAPFLTGQRVELRGPAVVLPAGTTLPFAMAVHELATNALKYGALSVPEGRVAVSWRLAGAAPGLLRLRWAEAGGPRVAGPPTRRGFGSRVIEGTVRRQLGGAVSLGWEATGLVCEVEVPLGRAPDAAGADTD